MNPAQIEIHVGELIEAAAEKHSPPLHVCWWDNKLQCLPAVHTTDRHPIFLTVSFTVLQPGLPVRRWTELGKTIYKFLKGLEE